MLIKMLNSAIRNATVIIILLAATLQSRQKSSLRFEHCIVLVHFHTNIYVIVCYSKVKMEDR